MSNRRPLPADRDRDRDGPVRPVAPDRPASSPSGADGVLGLQSTAGNAAVVSMLHGGDDAVRSRAPGRGGATAVAGALVQVGVQRLWDDEAEDETGESVGTSEESAGEAPAEEGGETDAGESPEVDDAGAPDAGALDAAEAVVAEDLDPPRVVDTLGSIAAEDAGSGPGDFPVTGDGTTAQALFIQRDPPDGPGPAPRPGGPGDVIKALMPFVQPALDRLLADVLATIRKLKTGEKIAATVVIAPILIGPLTQPGPRRLALDQLDGTDVTFGVIPNLQLKPSISDGQLKGATLTYDLAPALRKLGVPF